MRIEVVAEERISPQARTYAEYRVFAALTQCGKGEYVHDVRVLLRPVSSGRHCEEIACTVVVTFAGSDLLQVRANGPHAYAAINRAVERLRIHAPPAEGLDRVSV